MKEIYTNRKCGIELPDKNPNKRPNDSIDITIGVFFDGTGNNKYNVYFNQRAKEQFKRGRRNINHLKVTIAIKVGVLMLLYCGKCMIRVSHIKKRFI